MDVREKLVEMIKCAENQRLAVALCCTVEELKDIPRSEEYVADHLIANGVTVQEWISVKDRLPQEDEPEKTFCEQVQVLLDDGFVSTGWCNKHFKMWWHLDHRGTQFIGFDYEHTPVIAWQPLAQPPKGK